MGEANLRRILRTWGQMSGLAPCGVGKKVGVTAMSDAERSRSRAAIDRREFLTLLGPAVTLPCLAKEILPCAKYAVAFSRTSGGFKLRYLLSSSLYGRTDVREILPEVRKVGAEAIDLWPAPHGNQREQVDQLGEDRFRELLQGQEVRLGCMTRYDLGPFKLSEEIRLARRLDCNMIVTGARGPVGLSGGALRLAVQQFITDLQPILAHAEESAVIIAIENHSRSLIESPDSLRWFAELAPATLAIAFAPYHLPQDAEFLAGLIREVGHKIAIFYMWQHGKGSLAPQPLEDELLQLPGRGPLDFRPLLTALRDVNFRGYSSIFMHPYPRGRSVRKTIEATTAEILRARDYLERCLKEINPHQA